MRGVFRRGDAGPGDVQPPLHVPHRPRQVRAGLQLQVTRCITIAVSTILHHSHPYFIYEVIMK